MLHYLVVVWKVLKLDLNVSQGLSVNRLYIIGLDLYLTELYIYFS